MTTSNNWGCLILSRFERLPKGIVNKLTVARPTLACISIILLTACASAPVAKSTYLTAAQKNIVVGNVDGLTDRGAMKLLIDGGLIGEINDNEYIRFGLPPGEYIMELKGTTPLFSSHDKVRLLVRRGETHAYNIGETNQKAIGLIGTVSGKREKDHLIAVIPKTYEAQLKTCCVDVSSRAKSKP